MTEKYHNNNYVKNYTDPFGDPWTYDSTRKAWPIDYIDDILFRRMGYEFGSNRIVTRISRKTTFNDIIHS